MSRIVNKTFGLLSKLRIIKRAVKSALLKQLIVCARLGDLSVLNHQNIVSVLNGGKSVGDDKAGSALHQLGHRFLNLDLRA